MRVGPIFTATAALASGFASAQSGSWPCDNVRREWRTLTPDLQQSYIDAVNILMQNGQYMSWLQTHLQISMDHFGHTSDGFFPWHRWYTWQFENQLRSLGPQYACLSIPYWDWSTDVSSFGQTMQGADFYQRFGGAGSPGSGTCIHQLRDASGRTPFPTFSQFTAPPDQYGRWQGGCVRRQQTGGQHIAGVAEMMDLMTRNNQYSSDPRFGVGWRNAAIQSHNAVHNMLGGNMATVYSCMDPIFMGHHSYIDKLWDTWQQCHGYTNFPSTITDDSGGAQWSANQPMPGYPQGFNPTPMQVMDIRTIGGRPYSYAPSAIESTTQWQAVLNNPAICAGRAQGRDLGLGVNVTIEQRTLDELDIFARTIDTLSKTTNDTSMITYLAARTTCEQTDSVGNYTEPTLWAKNMGTTGQELRSALNSPCIEVLFDDIPKALADADAYDTEVYLKMRAMIEQAGGDGSTPTGKFPAAEAAPKPSAQSQRGPSRNGNRRPTRSAKP